MWSRITLWLGSLGFVAAVIGPLFAHLRFVLPMVGFATMGVGLLASLLALICGIVALLRGPAARRGTAIGGMIPAFLVIAAVIAGAGAGRSAPRINDITTDTVNPPQFTQAQRLPENKGRNLSYPGESFASQQRAGYGEIAPLHLAMPPAEAFAKVLEKANSVPGWEITLANPRTRIIEGVATSWLFRFEDDFIISVRDAADGGSVVHMRSKSRDGKGDVGANARRIRDFFALFG